MKLIYQGPHDGVDVPLPDGRVVTAMHGVPALFPDATAKSLMAQGVWQVDEPAPKSKQKAQKAEEE